MLVVVGFEDFIDVKREVTFDGTGAGIGLGFGTGAFVNVGDLESVFGCPFWCKKTFALHGS